ncbi:hypothetical protein Tco_0441370 [Tanacetum coccineum]
MSSPEHISPLPAISPFICTDSSEAPDSSDGPPSQDPYVATVARWRSRVTARPSSSHEFPIALVTAPPGIRRRSATLIRPGEAIPFGRPYRTHLNGPRKLLTARKRVGPLPSRRLASRHASPRSPDHHSSSSSSSSDSSPVHSLGLDASDQAHSGSSTRDVSPRLCYPPRVSTRSRDSSEGPMHSSPHSAGPSRKRCRSPVDSVPLSMPVTGSLAPTRADLSPPRKRFRDSYSSEASLEGRPRLFLQGGINVDDTEDYELTPAHGETAKVGIDPMTAPLVEEEIVEPAGEDSPDSSGTRDGIVRSVEDMPVDLGDAVRDFYHHMSEVRVDRIVGIETAQRRLEADQLITSGDRARMAKMIYSLRLENLKSVGSPPSRVILFGDIPTVIPSTSVVAPETSTIAPVISPAAPVVDMTFVASPTGLCGLVPYTGSDSDSPDEVSSPEHISSLLAISPFVYTDSSKAPDSSDRPPSQDPYVATVARWRSRVTARTSSSHEFPIAPVTAPPGIHRRSATLIRPREAIPFDRPYRTHLNGLRKLLTARKKVRPLPARRLASRHASPCSPDHHSSSSSSSSDSSPVHSLGLDAPDQAHSGSLTRDVSPRLCYPPRRAP